MINIEKYTINDLRSLVRSKSFWKLDPLPITKHRAKAQIKNPRAEDSDLALLVAYQDDRVIGYLGILPDQFFFRGKLIKIGWLSTWWIQPNQNLGGAGVILLFQAINAYNGRIGVAHFTESAGNVYMASKKFHKVKDLPGFIFLALYDRILVDKRFNMPFLVSQSVSFFGAIFNSLIKKILRIWEVLNPISQELTIEYLSEIDEQTEQFINEYSTKDLTKRSKPELNWIIHNPWVKNAPMKDKNASRYQFSSSAKRFEYIPLKISDYNKHVVAFILLNIHNNNLTIPFIVCKQELYSEVTKIILHHFVKLEATRLTTFNMEIIRNISKLVFPFFFRIKHSKMVMVTTKLSGYDYSRYNFQDGDADRGFT